MSIYEYLSLFNVKKKKQKQSISINQYLYIYIYIYIIVYVYIYIYIYICIYVHPLAMWEPLLGGPPVMFGGSWPSLYNHPDINYHKPKDPKQICYVDLSFGGGTLFGGLFIPRNEQKQWTRGMTVLFNHLIP